MGRRLRRPRGPGSLRRPACAVWGLVVGRAPPPVRPGWARPCPRTPGRAVRVVPPGGGAPSGGPGAFARLPCFPALGSCPPLGFPAPPAPGVLAFFAVFGVFRFVSALFLTFSAVWLFSLFTAFRVASALFLTFSAAWSCRALVSHSPPARGLGARFGPLGRLLLGRSCSPDAPRSLGDGPMVQPICLAAKSV